MLLKISNDIFNTTLDLYASYCVPGFDAYLCMQAGEDQYKLLAYLSNQLPKGSKAADFGTYRGNSAIALASNKDVSVVTIDLVDLVEDGQSYKQLPNITFLKGNAKLFLNTVRDAQIIVIDLSPHGGEEEYAMLENLKKLKYKGIVVLDDIYFCAEMMNFWNKIKLKKLDVSPYGHWSGTGIVIFDPKVLDVEVNL